MTRATRGGSVELLRIEKLVAGGEGLAREAGRPVTFVPGAAPGDLVRVRIVEERKGHRRARLLEIVEPGPGRRASPCPESDECGGCPWIHLDDAAQAAAAIDVLTSALQRARTPVASGALRPALPLPSPLRQRRRMRLHLDLRREPIAGFLRSSSHEIHAMESCLALDPALENLRRAVVAALPSLAGALGPLRAELSIDLPRDDAGTALLRVPESIPRERLLDPRERLRDPRERLLDALRALSEAAPVLVALAAEDPAQRVELGQEAVAFRRGPAEEPERWPALAAPGAFMQATRSGNELLVSRVLDAARALGLSKGSRVLELFAGSGNFTLPLAGLGCDVQASDTDARAASLGERAIAACEPALARPPRIEARDAVAHASESAARGERFDAVVVDPPRTGAREEARLLGALTDRVLWVSCDAPTFARDAEILGRDGFVVTRIEPLLLFPQTAHFETVATIERG